MVKTETISRLGFGQVEPNHLSGQKGKQTYAQLPAKNDIEVLENGQFVKYDYLNGEVNFTGAGEWLMVFNEIKLYENKETRKDFALTKEGSAPYGEGATSGYMVPRCLKTNIGDIYTTNCVGAGNTSGKAKYAGIEITEGDVLAPNATGYLTVVREADAETELTGMSWLVVEITNLPDMQVAVKLQRIA